MTLPSNLNYLNIYVSVAHVGVPELKIKSRIIESGRYIPIGKSLGNHLLITVEDKNEKANTNNLSGSNTGVTRQLPACRRGQTI
jgi:hypothetical protein